MASFRTLIFGLAAVVALGVFAAHLPPRVKLLLIFPIVVGSAAGTAVACIARANGPRSRAATVAVAAALVPVALLVNLGESYRQWRADRRAEIVAHLLAQPGGRDLLDRALSDRPAANAAEADLLRPYRALLNPTLADQLVARIGDAAGKLRPNATAAIGFAAFESALAWVAGVAVAARVFVTSSGRPEDFDARDEFDAGAGFDVRKGRA